MIKKISILIIIITCTNSAFGQLIEGNQKQRVGMRMGFGISSFKGEELENYRPYFGYQFGVFQKIELGRHTQFRYEVIADLRGSKFKVIGDSTYSKITTMFLNVPLEFCYLYNQKEKSDNEIYAGFQFSRVLVSRLFAGVDQRPKETNINIKRFDYGITFGHAWNKPNWGFKLGVFIGLADINDGLNYTYIPGLKRTNKKIGTQSLNIGFVF